MKTFFMMHLVIGCALALGASSCYRMPTDDDYSLVPTTNNPALTCEKQDSMMPGVSY